MAGLRSIVEGTENNSGVKKSAGNARGDGDEVALSEEDFDLRRARHFGKVDGASAADEGYVLFGRGDAGKFGNEFAGMNAKRLDSSLLRRGL